MKILISTGDKSEKYEAALRSCGAEVVGGYLPELRADCDALVLCGGADIDPAIYGENNMGSFGIDPARDAIETKLMQLYADKPILGICRGEQLINALCGGTLVQDLPNKAAHTGEDYAEVFHSVKAAPGSRMEALFGAEFEVNSSHHQAIKTIAPGFRATLFAPDGTIEAIEHESRPILGVQWHPERTAYAEKLFRWFLSLAE